MRKIIALMLILAMIMSLASCSAGGGENGGADEGKDNDKSETTKKVYVTEMEYCKFKIPSTAASPA